MVDSTTKRPRGPSYGTKVLGTLVNGLGNSHTEETKNVHNPLVFKGFGFMLLLPVCRYETIRQVVIMKVMFYVISLSYYILIGMG